MMITDTFATDLAGMNCSQQGSARRDTSALVPTETATPRDTGAPPPQRALERLVLSLIAEPAQASLVMPRVLRAIGRTFGFRTSRAVLLRDDGLFHLAHQWSAPERRGRANGGVMPERARFHEREGRPTLALVAMGRAIGYIELSNPDPDIRFVKNVTLSDSVLRQLGTYLRLASLEERLPEPDPARGRRAGMFDWQPRSDAAYFSPTFLALLGFAPEHSADRGGFLRESLHPDDLPGFLAAVDDHVAHDAPLDLPCRMRDAHGRYRMFRMRGIAVRNGGGECLRLFGSIVRRGRPTGEQAGGDVPSSHCDQLGGPAPHEDQQSAMFALAHTVAEPLRSIDGVARHLQERLAQLGHVEENDLAGRIRAAVGRTLADVERLVELSVGGRGSLSPMTVDLSAMARAILSEPGSAQQPPVLDIEPDLRATVDPGLMRTVLALLADYGRRTVGNVWRIRFGRIEGVHPGFFHLDFDGDDDARPAAGHDDLISGTQVALAAATRALARQNGRIWARAEPGRAASLAFTLSPEPAPEGTIPPAHTGER